MAIDTAPDASASSAARLGLAALAPGDQDRGYPDAFGQRRDDGDMLARKDLGRRHQGRLGTRLDRLEHGEEGDHRLAAADVALQQANHRLGRAHVGGDLAERGRLGAGQGEAQGIARGRGKPAVADDRPPRPLTPAQPHQPERELVRQQLVIGQAPARLGARLQIRQPVRVVGGAQRIGPGRPPDARHPGRIVPFRQIRCQRQRRGDHPGQRPRRKPGGHRINRLDALKACDLAWPADMIGVGHLQPVAEALDPPADDAAFARRQDGFQVVGLGVEVDQVQARGLVMADDPIGRAADCPAARDDRPRR